jgi:hypothetical protein
LHFQVIAHDADMINTPRLGAECICQGERLPSALEDPLGNPCFPQHLHIITLSFDDGSDAAP